MEAVSWQLSGNSREANTSAKSIYNKILAACQSQVEELKQMRTESMSQQEELIKALKALATAVVGARVNVRDYIHNWDIVDICRLKCSCWET
jgi:hypothetical protein